MHSIHSRAGETGAFAVELALAFPLITTLFLFAVAMSSFIEADQRLSAISREAANSTLRECMLNPVKAAAKQECIETVRDDVREFGKILFNSAADFELTLSIYECTNFSCNFNGSESCACGGSVARVAVAAHNEANAPMSNFSETSVRSTFNHVLKRRGFVVLAEAKTQVFLYSNIIDLREVRSTMVF